MATVKSQEKKEDVIDISQFFTTENEEKGIWFEAKSGSIPSGVEFLVYGPNSKKAWSASNRYLKAMESLEDESDEEYKHEETNALLIEAVTALCGGIRGKDGKKIMIGDREADKDDIKLILTQAPLIALSIWRFCQKSEGFIEKKKKN